MSTTKEEKSYTVICPKCEKQAPWLENSAKYGKNYGDSYMCYFCKDCDTYVGCHNNTKEPLGTMADAPLRKLRMTCHRAFDGRWRNCSKLSRGAAYKMLSTYMGKECHIGESDLDMCQKILDLCNHKINWNFRFLLKTKTKKKKVVKVFVMVKSTDSDDIWKYRKSFQNFNEAHLAISSFCRRMTQQWSPNETYWEPDVYQPVNHDNAVQQKRCS